MVVYNNDYERTCSLMPWTSADAEGHNKAANTPKKRSVWAKVANEILKKTGDDGRAIREANAAIANMSSHPRSRYLAMNARSAGNYRIETHSGQEYIVVPLVALVEGVIQGVQAEEPELALASEFARFPTAWNGRPVTIDHPTAAVVGPDGTEQVVAVSASTDPDIQSQYQVGHIFNSTLTADHKLRMEAWLDPIKMQRHSKDAAEMLSKIKRGEQIEVSTGLFANAEPTAGEHNGREYATIWRGVVPDHLALLPGDLKGACSIEDGCGVFANKAPCNCKGACGCSQTKPLQYRKGKNMATRKQNSRVMPPDASEDRGNSEVLSSPGSNSHTGKRFDNSDKTVNAEMADEQVPAGKSKKAKGKNNSGDYVIGEGDDGCEYADGGRKDQARVMPPDESEDRGTSEVLNGPGSSSHAGQRFDNAASDADQAGDEMEGDEDEDDNEDIPNDGKKSKPKRNAAAGDTNDASGETRGTRKKRNVFNSADNDDADEDDASEYGKRNNRMAPVDPRDRDPWGVDWNGGSTPVKGMSARHRRQLAEVAFQLSLNARSGASSKTAGGAAGAPVSDHRLLDNDVRESLQSGLEQGHQSDRDANVYLHGFTPTQAVYSRYDTNEGRRNTYSRSYSIDKKSKAPTFGKEEKKVRLTTEITPLQAGPGGSNAGNSDTAEGENIFMGNRQQQETSMTANAAGDSSNQNGAKRLTTEEYLSALPSDLRESVEQGLRMHSSYKATLVAKVKAHKSNKFSEEVLKGYDITTLENLVALVGEPDPIYNYAGLGGGSDTMHLQGAQGLRDQAAQNDEFFAAPPPRLGLVANKGLEPGARADSNGKAA